MLFDDRGHWYIREIDPPKPPFPGGTFHSFWELHQRSHNGILIQFLPIFSLSSADLIIADLIIAELMIVDLITADLIIAELVITDLIIAELIITDVIIANLIMTDLIITDFMVWLFSFWLSVLIYTILSEVPSSFLRQQI